MDSLSTPNSPINSENYDIAVRSTRQNTSESQWEVVENVSVAMSGCQNTHRVPSFKYKIKKEIYDVVKLTLIWRWRKQFVHIVFLILLFIYLFIYFISWSVCVAYNVFEINQRNCCFFIFAIRQRGTKSSNCRSK